MSMRPSVDRARIEQFLTRLGSTTQHGARIYLVGGSALVHAGLRGRTLDIDLAVEGGDEGETLSAIRQLTHDLQINVELASPADFIPLPEGSHDRAIWVGRYGALDVFYFDFYGIALSKVARGNERDTTDVALMAEHGFIRLDMLDELYHQIVPLVGQRPYFNLDPEKFAANYAAIRQRLAADSTPSSEGEEHDGE